VKRRYLKTRLDTVKLHEKLYHHNKVWRAEKDPTIFTTLYVPNSSVFLEEDAIFLFATNVEGAKRQKTFF